MDIVSRQRINLLIHLSEIQSLEPSNPVANLILRVADECAFSKMELGALLSSPDPIGSFGALSASQKKQYMYNICELMTLVDLTKQKKLLCQKIAYDLEYDSNQFNHVIGEFHQQKSFSTSVA